MPSPVGKLAFISSRTPAASILRMIVYASCSPYLRMIGYASCSPYLRMIGYASCLPYLYIQTRALVASRQTEVLYPQSSCPRGAASLFSRSPELQSHRKQNRQIPLVFT